MEWFLLKVCQDSDADSCGVPACEGREFEHFLIDLLRSPGLKSKAGMGVFFFVTSLT
jgi:hypothetical protein